MELRRKFRVQVVLLVTTALTILTTSFSVLTAPMVTAAAQTIPYKINFQGRLTDNNGSALSDGFYNIKFRIWTASSGGTNQWEGDRVFGASDNRVQVVGGLFNIQFGDTTLGDPALSPALFSGAYPLYLEVELPTPATATCAANACTSFTEGAMTPRQPLASSAYAFNSQTLGGLDSSAFGQLSSANTYTAAQTIQTSSPVALVAQATASNPVFSVDTTSNHLVLGKPGASGINTDIIFNNASNSNQVSIKVADGTAAYALTLPSIAPTTSLCLQSGATTPGLLVFAGCSSSGVNQQLSNLSGTVAANLSIVSAANNTLNLGTAANVWQNVYASNLDAGTSTTALTIGTAATTTALTIGRASVVVSIPGGLSSAGTLTTSGNISTTGSGTITSAGAISAPTSANTINNLVINAGSLSNVGPNITGAGAVNLASTTNALTLTSGSGTLVLGSNTIQRAAAGLTLDVANTAPSTLTVTNSNASFVASLSVEGGVGIGTGQVFSVGAANGSTLAACLSTQYLASAAASGGIITAGSCATNDLQTVYGNSIAPATVALTDAKDFVINATDTTTDPSVIVNLQCATCSLNGGRFAVQNKGTDVLTVSPTGSIAVAPTSGQNVTVNLSGSSSAAFTATSAPTTDIVSINNIGQPVATAGVNGLDITYVGGSGAIEASGARIDATPGGTSGSTWNGLRIVSTTGATAGVALNGIKVDGPAVPGGGTETGLNITTGWDIGLNIQSGGIQMSSIADPTAPASGSLAVYARSIAGRTMLKSEGSSGVSYALQPSLFQQNIWLGQPGSANNTAQWQSQGAPGTYTTVPTLTNAANQTLGYNAVFTTGAVTNAGNGFMQSTSSYYRGSIDNSNSGYFTMSRVSFPGSLANYTSTTLGARFWCGMTSQTTIASMGSTDTPTGDFSGFRLSGSAGETTFHFLTRNNATTTNQNTGVTLITGDAYDLYMFVKNYDSASPTQNTTISWRIDDLTAGTAPVEGSQTLTLPTASTAMRYMTTLGTVNAAAKQLGIQRMYVETDR